MGPQPSKRFCEIEQASAFLGSLGDLELTQCSPGPLELTFQAVTIGQSSVFESSTNRPLLSVGRRSTGYVTISPMSQGTVRGRFRGHTPRVGQMLLMDPGGDSFQIVSENQRQIALSVPVALCARIAAAEHGCEPTSNLWQWNLVDADPGKSQRFLELLNGLLSEDTALGSASNLETELAEWLVGFACSGADSKQYAMVSRDKQRIVRQSIELMTASLSEPPSVLELCELTGATRRVLFYAFQELMQASPIQYSRSLRCHASRKLLLQKDCLGVQSVASQFGFTHFGRFAIDYARIFGESPGQTLGRTRARAGPASG